MMDAVKKADLPLQFSCGGEGTCGDCIIQIIEGTCKVKPTAALSSQLIAEGFALACQTEIADDLAVVLPHFQELAIKSVVGSAFFDINKDNISGIFEHYPAVVLTELQVPAPTLEDNYSDLRRLTRCRARSDRNVVTVVVNRERAYGRAIPSLELVLWPAGRYRFGAVSRAVADNGAFHAVDPGVAQGCGPRI